MKSLPNLAAPTMSHKSEKIRLTFLARSLDYGGTQRQLVTLAKALDKNRFDVSILTFYSGQPLEAELINSGVRIVSVNKQGRWDLLPFLGRLKREVKALRPDILHSYLDIPNVLALWLRHSVSARVVWGVRASSMELRHYDWLFRLAAGTERALADRPDLIIVNSVAARKHHIAQGFPEHKLKLIPNGIETNVFKPDGQSRARVRSEWGIPENTRLVGTVGRLDPVKDIPSFLKAAMIVARQNADARFVCVGDGPARYVEELKEQARDLGFSERLVWAGVRSDVVAVYSALDLLVSASRAESFPNSVAEAMSCGVSCVVTDVGDSALLAGDCCGVVPPGSPESLASEILRSLDDNRAVRGRESRARIVENFDVQRLARLTEEAIANLAIPHP